MTDSKNNTGNRNTGNWNTGNLNTGNLNTGDLNTGNRNTGDLNTGNRNTGNRNTGDLNTGDLNTGDLNTGNRNTGNRNTGDLNTGNRNTGNRNTGNRNTGNWNTGNLNTGNLNTGDLNTGDLNTGNWNTGNWNTGYFNTETPDTILAFNKPCSREEWDNAEKPDFVFFTLTEWVSDVDMTDQEKIDNPTFHTTGGYLKTHNYKEAFQAAYANASDEDRARLLALPNFDADVFYEISGVDVRAKQADCEGRIVEIDGVKYTLKRA